MSDLPYSGPEVQPFLGFHNLPEVVKETGQRLGEYIYHPDVVYSQLLTLLAQSMDKTDQAQAEKRLRVNIQSSGRIIGEQPEQANEVRIRRDSYKDQYFAQLREQSAHTALTEVRESEAAKARRVDGFTGGTPKVSPIDFQEEDFPFFAIKPEVTALYEINPALLNQQIIERTLNSHTGLTQRTRKVFGMAGFSSHSTEYKLSLLCRIELVTKRLMVHPLVDNINFYNPRRSAPVEVHFGVENDKTPLVAKKENIERILLGNPQDPRFEQRMGTEFFAGYYELCQQAVAATLSNISASQRVRFYNLIKTVTFMRTSKRKSGESSLNLMGQILTPLRAGDYGQAEKEIKRLAFNNEDLWPKFVRRLYPPTPEELSEFQREKEAVATVPETPKKTKKTPSNPMLNDCDPSLKKAVVGHMGETFVNPLDDQTYRVEGLASLKIKGEMQHGFVKVTTFVEREDGSMGEHREFLTYGGLLRLLKDRKSEEEMS